MIQKYLKQIARRILQDEITSLKSSLETKKEKVQDQQDRINELVNLLELQKNNKKEMQKTIKEYKELLEKEDEENELEKEWNNKYNKIYYSYRARPLFKSNGEFLKYIEVDPRIFFSNIKNYKLPKLTADNNDNDVIASRCLNWVIRNIKYKSEEKEQWQFCDETLTRKAGDCEDGAILLANIMLKSGIPYWRIWLNAGDVQGGGHAYLTYLAEKNNQWYILDWCYWPNESKGLQKKWDDASKYFGLWFSWNRDYVFDTTKKK